MWKHIKLLFLYIFHYHEACFKSEFSISDSMSEISDLVSDESNSIEGKIKTASNEVILYCMQHNISARGGTPMIPIFKGRFNQKDETVILSGRFEVDSFCKLVVCVLFAAMFIASLLTLAEIIWSGKVPWTSSGVPGGELIALLILMGLLEFAFWLGRKDIKYISEIIQNVLQKAT